MKIFNKNISIEKIVYLLLGIFYFFLFRRGGDTKYRIAWLLTITIGMYLYKYRDFKIMKEYKKIYIIGFVYMGLLFFNFIMSENKTGERLNSLLGMSIYSIGLFLILINFKVERKIYKILLMVMSFFSIGSLMRGMADLYLHIDKLKWYRLAGRTYTTIYAGELGIYFFIGIIAIFVYKNKYLKLGYMIYTLIALILIYYTKSRNTMLMLPVTLAILYFIKNRKQGIKTGIILVLFLAFLLKNPYQIKGLNRLSSISTIEKVKDDIRVDIFKEGIKKGKENLLLGEGFYKHLDTPFDVNRGAKHPHYHNIFIETFATQGIINLIAYISFLLSILYYMIKNYLYEKDEEIKKIRLIPIGVFIFIILYGLAEPVFYFTKVYMVLFAILVLNFIRIEN